MTSFNYFGTFALFTALALAPAARSQQNFGGPNGVNHVLLISVDGMHALDFLNCASGIPGVNNGAPYCPNLAQLAASGITYTNASTSKPSDSFPGRS